ncbi:MAG: pyruvate oxidase, partial [Nocardioidaceae bacterium]|nr:pyruvate oxidase [Nocardioidaceae bacterium]
TEAIRQEERLRWIGVRHEEVAAFAAGAQAQLTGTIGVCMGTVGPGSIHLLNGLYDAKKSHAPLLAICGQVPIAEIGSDYFQEVNNDVLFSDVAVFAQTVTSPSQLPHLFEQAVNAATSHRGVSVLTLPADVGDLTLPRDAAEPRFVGIDRPTTPDPTSLHEAADLLNEAAKITLLVGMGAREAREEVLEVARQCAAPMVLTLKGKETLERDNVYQVGQNGLLGNPAAAQAFDDCDLLFMVGTDFPYRDFYPSDATVIQLDARADHIGRRTSVDLGLVGHAAPTLQALLPLLSSPHDRAHLDSARETYDGWVVGQRALTDPAYEDQAKGMLRGKLDNPDGRIRPEALAAAIDRHANDDAIFTADTGMSTVWLARHVTLLGTRRLLGSFNLGSMANAMPQALGAQALDRQRQVVAFCGDGGLTMLLGDLITAVSEDLPVKLIVFDNGRLGMVKLEQEEVSQPESGTVLDDPDLARVAEAIGLRSLRVTNPADLDDAIRRALATPGPVLVDVLTNPQEIALPPQPGIHEAWGFAVAKVKETLGQGEGDD